MNALIACLDTAVHVLGSPMDLMDDKRVHYLAHTALASREASGMRHTVAVLGLAGASRPFYRNITLFTIA